ncbi:SusC/RagA family TonB-linked outer membrane protein [Urechidicola vernalis]|uniref:TonB-dependent receptor n=1 Tax=Urechidicola vernalis TaxID=3075600 RepID=A0ABU2Y5H6_9FLAO|nr:TonB-dependent receptor [Urechidicola sp. P050]MDT0553430.1 TonB-dependent receptor [Urechidicola sp. P050]
MNSKILFFGFFITSILGFSQNVSVSGVVSDESTGEPLPGVSVIIKDSNTGTSTDFDGLFYLDDVPINSVLIVSSIGFKEVEVVVLNAEPLNIALTEDTATLDEVVVIGYGSQKKRELTGAVSTVSSQTLDKLKPVKVEQALQGTVTGVNVTTQSGAPGAGLDIRIRGISTNGSGGPLVIIDGYQGDLSILNPNDIETITVLKDAQAAIYGTVGANGVVLVTTKQGRKNAKTKFNFNSSVGFQEATREISLLNEREYALLLNESYAAGGQEIPFDDVSGLSEGTDWQGEVLNSGVPIISHDISVSGGSEKISYALSGSHVYQQGIIAPKKSDFRRNTARLYLGAELFPKLHMKTNIIYTYLDRDAINDSGLGSVLFNGLNSPPNLDPYDSEGNYSLIPNTTGLGIEIINPLAQIDNTYNDYDLNKLNGSFTLDYDFTEDLKLTGRIGFNNGNSKGKSFSKIVDYGGKVFDVTKSSVSQNRITDNDYSLDFFLSYDKLIKEDHKLNATVGTTIYKQWGSGLFATGYDIPNNSWEFADISLATGTVEARSVGSYEYDERRLSYFARVQYDYKGKYLLSAMFRRDASSRFGPENRVGYFPSATFGWVASDESFLEDSKYIDFFKIRASYGVLGNDNIGNNGYVGSLDGEGVYVFDGNLVTGTAIGQLANPELQWEEAKKFDVGIDLNFLENKISIVADYFINTRDNLLIQNIPVSGIVGVNGPGGASPTINAGVVRNSGFEFAVTYKDDFSDDFSLNTSFNITTLDNEVLEVNNSTGFLEGGSFGVGQPAPSRMEVGYPIGYFYGYKTYGIFQNEAELFQHPSQLSLGAEAAPGDLRYVDLNEDGVIDANDRTYLGDPIPDVTMGFNISLNYKDLDFVSYVFASVGNEMVRNYERALSDVNRLNYVLDRWTGEGTSNEVPRVTTAATANNVFSDFYVEDASYVRIQNIQLGYTIPVDYTEKVGIEKLRLYAGVNNLYTFTKYKGYDPGASNGAPIGGGIDYGFYPIPRTYLLGLNLTF